MTQAKVSGMFAEDLLQEWKVTSSDQVVLKHPFALGESVGETLVRDLAAMIAAPLTALEQVIALDGDDIKARGWRARFDDHDIRGVTVAVRKGGAVELQMMLSSFPKTVGWRDEVYRLSEGLIPAELWELPVGTDQSIPEVDPEEKLDPKFPFEVTDDIVFNSPVLLRPVEGIEDVRTIISHASAVYGEREYGPRVMSGPHLLSLWTCGVSGVSIEAANLIQVDSDRRVREMTLAFRPWPAVQLFRDRVVARTRDLIDRSYYTLG